MPHWQVKVAPRVDGGWNATERAEVDAAVGGMAIVGVSTIGEGRVLEVVAENAGRAREFVRTVLARANLSLVAVVTSVEPMP